MAATTRAAPRPVILATFSVRIDPRAERMAFDSALDVGARLIIANLMMLPPYPTTIMLAREYATLPHEEDLEAVRATAARASALGIGTELLRISSRRPLAALVELISNAAPRWSCSGPTCGGRRGGSYGSRPAVCGAGPTA